MRQGGSDSQYTISGQAENLSKGVFSSRLIGYMLLKHISHLNLYPPPVLPAAVGTISLFLEVHECL